MGQDSKAVLRDADKTRAEGVAVAIDTNGRVLDSDATVTDTSAVLGSICLCPPTLCSRVE